MRHLKDYTIPAFTNAETLKQNSDTMHKAFDSHYRDQHVEPCESETIEDICLDTDQTVTVTLPHCTEEIHTRDRPFISEPYVHTPCEKNLRKQAKKRTTTVELPFN
jgi:hypothetical protein